MKPLLHQDVKLDRAVFILSLDTELAWGSFDRADARRHWPSYARTRPAIEHLLRLLETHHIAATWGVVGHLFLRSCSAGGPDHHNHVLQPEYSWYPQGWLSHDPRTDVERDPFFYAPDVIDRIVASRPTHELAGHTFTHAILGDPECTREVAVSQIEANGTVIEQRGGRLRSLIFPRNSVGHLDVLSELGLTAFRGPEINWYQRGSRRRWWTKAAHWLDRRLALTPPVPTRIEGWRLATAPRWTFNLPASMFYPPVDGPWRSLPISARVRQATRGIDAAVARGGLFHLWFHPFNLATSPALLDGLDAIFARVAGEVQAGRLHAWTMAETANHLEALIADD